MRASQRVGGYKFTIEIQPVSAGVSATGQGFAVRKSGPGTERSRELEHNSPFLRVGTASSTNGALGASVGASSNPITQAFNQLERDLKAGNTAAAQQDFSTIQQDLQNGQGQTQTQGTGHHHHHAFSSQSSTSPLAQIFSQLGQALQNGNLSSAQQAYSTLQQDFQQFASAGNLGVGTVNTTA
jgi:hypothetical protein